MKRIKLIKTSLILILFISFISVAQVKTFTIDEAIQTAIENNRDIKIALMNVQKADAAVSEAFGYALPSLDASGNFSRFLKKPKMSFPDFEALLTNATYSILFDENVIPRDDSKYRPVNNILQSFVQANNFTANLSLTQTLFNSAVFRGIGASRIYLDLAKEDLRKKVAETVLSVQQAFYGVLVTKELLTIAEDGFKNAQDNFTTVNAMFKQGLVAEFDKLQAEVQVENIRPVVSQVENNLANTKNTFKIVIGIDQQTDIDVSGEFTFNKIENLNEEDLVQQAVQSNYGIKTLTLKQQVDEAFVDLDRAEFWPTLSAFGNYSYAGTSDKWNFQNYSAFTIGLSFSMNIFKGGQTKSKIEQSTIIYKQTEEQLSQLKDLIRSQVKAKLLEINRVTALLDAEERNVQVAQRSYDIAVINYKEGTSTQVEVQNTDLALKRAKINRLQSLYSYMITKFELVQLLGQTDERYMSTFRESEN